MYSIARDDTRGGPTKLLPLRRTAKGGLILVVLNGHALDVLADGALRLVNVWIPITAIRRWLVAGPVRPAYIAARVTSHVDSSAADGREVGVAEPSQHLIPAALELAVTECP